MILAPHLEVGVAVPCVFKVHSAFSGEVERDCTKQHPFLSETAGGRPKLKGWKVQGERKGEGKRREGGERKGEGGGRGEGGGGRKTDEPEK